MFPPIIEIVTGILLFLTLYFEVFLIVTYIKNSEDYVLKKQRDPLTTPTATIIIPAWNEGKTLTGTVDSLLALDYPKDKFNLFIVDDGSTDNTLEVANHYKDNPQVQIFHKENGGKHTALNFGIEKSTSEFIGCLDADSFVDKNALKAIMRHFEDLNVMAVTPSVQIYKPTNLLQRIQSVEYMIGEFTRKTFSKFDGLYVTPGPFSIYRRSIFKKIGNFIPAYNTEDMEMALRMQSHRMKITNAHDALVYTVSPKSIPALYKQRVRWVSGFLKNSFFNYRFMFLRPKYGELGMLTMPFAFMSIFIALGFTTLWFYSLIHSLYEQLFRWSVIPPRFDLTKIPQFDWFSLNLEFSRILIYLLLCITVFFIIRGILIARGRLALSRDVFYFLFLYAFIAPFWLAKSVYNLITSKDANWR